MRLDGWSLNEKLDTVKERLERVENLLAALARKTYGLEDLVIEELSKLKKEKPHARKRNVQKDKGPKTKS
tara:strand:- start:278 stop:487 length:210 start_codon:yes stop_codon:yes gene_type:complete